MTRTVDELRNEIRIAVGRFERQESTAFTKESLAAIAAALGQEIEGGRLPPKAELRARIRSRVDDLDESAATDRPFRKGELAAIAAVLPDDESDAA